MYAIQFTDGSYLKIFPQDIDAPYYATDTAITESNSTYVLTNSFAAIRSIDGTTFEYDFIDGKTDLDGHYWTRSANNIVIYDEQGGTALATLSVTPGVVILTSSSNEGQALRLSTRSFTNSSFSTNFYSSYFFNGVNANNEEYDEILTHDYTIWRKCCDIIINDNGDAVGLLNNYIRSADLPGVIDGKYGVAGNSIDISSIDFSLSLQQVDINDPYASNGTSTHRGGSGVGAFADIGENVGIPGLPTLSAVDTGFITLYVPSTSQLNSLSAYMWSGLFDIETWKKIMADPMDAVLGLAIVPVSIPTGAAQNVTIGNAHTNIAMPIALRQYVDVDCGTIYIDRKWDGYLDYDPYTKFEIYLPYIGTRPLAADDIMGRKVHVKYNVDILSGACCAFVECDGKVFYTFIGQCSASVPITNNDFTNVINGVLSAGVAIGTMVATGGASAPVSAPALASTVVNDLKPRVEKSGAMAGTGGMLGIQTPYLIVSRPNQAVAENHVAFTGYPSFITAKLGNLKGYTEVEYMHLENINATETELVEIESLLKSGVIL